MKLLKEGANSIIFAGLLLTIFMTGIVRIEGKPLVILLRQVMLATLGAPTPGLQVDGDSSVLECDRNTGKCEWR